MTYGGILHLPDHPRSDMHGLVRAVVCAVRLKVAPIVEYQTGIVLPPSIWIAGLWAKSNSVIEQRVCEQHRGKVLVCSLWELYVDEKKYELLARKEKAK